MNQEAFLKLVEQAERFSVFEESNVLSAINYASKKVFEINHLRGADNVVFSSVTQYDPLRDYGSAFDGLQIWFDNSGALKQYEILVASVDSYLKTGKLPPQRQYHFRLIPPLTDDEMDMALIDISHDPSAKQMFDSTQIVEFHRATTVS